MRRAVSVRLSALHRHSYADPYCKREMRRFGGGCKQVRSCRIMTFVRPSRREYQCVCERGFAVKTLLGIASLSVLLVTLVSGCTPTDVSGSVAGTSSDRTELSGEQSADLQKILEYQRESKQDLAALVEGIEAQKARDQADKGPHPLVRDLAVAQQLAAEAQETDDKAELTALLHRIQFVLISMQAETPAATIVQRLERARLLLTLKQPSADDMAQAAKELMAVLETSFDVEPAELAPSVLAKVEGAKKGLDSRDANTARRLIVDAQSIAASHPINVTLRKAAASAKGAEEALSRGAQQVVHAEVAELAAMLDKVAAVAIIKGPEPETTLDESAAVEAQPSEAVTGEPAPQTPPTEAEPVPGPSDEAVAPAEPQATGTSATPAGGRRGGTPRGRGGGRGAVAPPEPPTATVPSPAEPAGASATSRPPSR